MSAKISKSFGEREIGLVLVGVGLVLVITFSLALYVFSTVRATILDGTFNVEAGRAVAYCGVFPSGTLLYISIRVLSGGDINFLVMDRTDWQAFQRGYGYYIYGAVSRTHITESEITWHPPKNVEVCFVFDNTFSTGTSKTVKATITASPKGKVVDYALYFLIPGAVLLIVGILLILTAKRSTPS